ncbi:hypothetical protein CXF85_02770 [Colwellia sp. 75C3]|uniref:hypothetical protein n=1 Tax=Colwellia sp. 75C3 TaxID=888425 RepID=UPI000C3334E3|nr:hypothetical protein [Colwellia sp. 75C3]PKG85731.1 hypothetical protein CXF85_02770 [Colwellia sp. 75C3]
MGTIKIRIGVAVPLILLTIPITILFSWDGEKQEQKYREKLKIVLQEVATICTNKQEEKYILGKDMDCTIEQLVTPPPKK